MEERCYICIDLKSFYASVECMERGLNPMTTNLVVADLSRTEKTICLAVTPGLKAYGISGRARLFEVVQKVKEVNYQRKAQLKGKGFRETSYDCLALAADPSLELSYLVAPPRMAHYLDYSTRVYQVYLNYISPEDIHVYSIDEVFIDATPYLSTYKSSPQELAKRMIQEVLETTGITATAGIGSNLYLAKIAMDIVAKHIQPDAQGVRIATIDEMAYRRLLWGHKPLTDFWRIGKGYAKKLAEQGLYTMGDIARCSVGKPEDYYNEALLYRIFGVNAELLIDHAWGWEPCTLQEIKSYRPRTNSLCSGQVLHVPYSFEKARMVVAEMVDLMVLGLVDKGLVTDQIVLTVGYDMENLQGDRPYQGAVVSDPYGRAIPKPAHGTVNLGGHTSSAKRVTQQVLSLYDRIMNPELTVRRVTLTANHVLTEGEVPQKPKDIQLDLFGDYSREEEEQAELEREKRRQQAILTIQKRFGKNAILKGVNLEEGATTRDRNRQIGGHKA